MKVTALEVFGIPESVLNIWHEGGHETLLPIQEKAVQKYGVLQGKNVVVFSPTSSGKTFIGEMAAVQTARRDRRAIYLVPQKALAEEKFHEFRRKYGPVSIRTVISTRDRKTFDKEIAAGDFEIAVVVFEKMQNLLVAQPELLDSVGLVVVDELQMIGDESRGARLELLLTKIREAASRPQIVGLSAVLGNSRALADWLDAGLCWTSKRPIELRRGVFSGGSLNYVEHNSKDEGAEELMDADAAKAAGDPLAAAVGHFIRQQEPCLVFCRSKNDSVTTAFSLCRCIAATPATEAIKELNDLEDSRGRDILLKLLQYGAAYHNADLDWAQRDLIERHFRKGNIRLLCATSTLAMGMNLPAKNVFVDTQRWNRGRMGGWMLHPIGQAEYENMSGRAGRLGLADDFGRAIIVAEGSFKAETYYRVFVKGKLGDLEPSLGRGPLGQHVVNIVASGLCQTKEQLKRLLLASFTGHVRWNQDRHKREFDRSLTESIRACVNGGLLEVLPGKRLAASEVGRQAALKGLSVDTAIRMTEFAGKLRGEAENVLPLEILLCLAGTEQGLDIHINLSTDEFRENRYLKFLKDALRDFPDKPFARMKTLLDKHHINYEKSQQAKKALMLCDWINDIPTREIESEYRCFVGNVTNIAREFSWLAEGFSHVAEACNWPASEVMKIRDISARLIHGVASEGIEVASIQVSGLGRQRIALLMEAGLDTAEKVAGAPKELVEKLVTRPVAERLLARIVEMRSEAEACLALDLSGDEANEANESCSADASDAANDKQPAGREESGRATGDARSIDVPARECYAELGMDLENGRPCITIYQLRQGRGRRRLLAGPIFLTEQQYVILEAGIQDAQVRTDQAVPAPDAREPAEGHGSRSWTLQWTPAALSRIMGNRSANAMRAAMDRLRRLVWFAADECGLVTAAMSGKGRSRQTTIQFRFQNTEALVR